MLPEAFMEKMQSLLGEEYGEFLESFKQEKYQALRLNPLKKRVGGGDAAEALRGVFPRLERVPWAEGGYYYPATFKPGKHPWHEAGVYYVQEPSAMAPAALLEARPGERVLDLCAAPGGKSTQIAAALSGGGVLFCNEIHPARAKILSENIERLGIGNAIVLNEPPERLAERFLEYFDRILVDAPCSGEGMFRKNAEACGEWSPENVALCAKRQDEILDCAARMLRPGGRLVYSTCTFSPEEDEGSVDRFLKRHEDFEILPLTELKQHMGLGGCSGRPGFVAGSAPELENTLRLWPHRVKGEGHFAAVMQKAGSLPQIWGGRLGALEKEEGIGLIEFSNAAAEAVGGARRSRGEAVGGRVSRGRADGGSKRAQRMETGELEEFCALQLHETSLEQLADAVGLQGRLSLVRSRDHFYLLTKEALGLDGLKTLRPGLHLGECRKNRFEPSHALALALAPKAAARIWNLQGEGPEIRAYLNGQTFPACGDPGWYLICVDGFGIGWGKLAGGVMKNHYPKGLRRAGIA